MRPPRRTSGRQLRVGVVLALVAWLVLAPSAQAAGAPRGQLVRSESLTSLGTTYERYQQRVGGVPVLGGEVVVTDAPGFAADLTLDRSRRGLKPPGRAIVTRVEAIAAARRKTRASDLRAPPRAGRAIVPRAGGARLVWRVLLSSGRPLASYEVLVDARTAAIVRVRDRLKRDTGRAAVFMPNPVVAQGSTLGLADDGDADSALLTALRTPVTLRRLERGTSCLKGRWVHARLPSGEVCSPPDADFTSVTRADDDFEALMAYVHIDRAQAYLQSLGFRSVLNRALPVLANARADDTSFYDPATRTITFGTGGPRGPDDGEDADIIGHEYGHAVQDAQVPDFGESKQGAAMGEGFGDYLQAALDAQRVPSAASNPCEAEWVVLGGEDECLVRADGNLTVADVAREGDYCGKEQDEHCVGEVWSGALWRIRTLIGGATADRLVVQSHHSLASSADFSDASIALIVADRALYGGVHERVLRDVLHDRGLLDRARPFLKLSGRLPPIGAVLEAKRFRVTVALSEPGSVRLSALVQHGAKAVVAPRTISFGAAGKRRVTLELTSAGLRRLTGRRRAVLRIRGRATFASGRSLPTVQIRRSLR